MVDFMTELLMGINLEKYQEKNHGNKNWLTKKLKHWIFIGMTQ